MVEKASLIEILGKLAHLAGRTPGMAFTGEAEAAFADIAPYRDGVIATGYYSGDSEWERHPGGDEIVVAVEGSTTLVVRVEGGQQRISLRSGELVVVPQGAWHRFESSARLKLISVTPQPTEHRLDIPGGEPGAGASGPGGESAPRAGTDVHQGGP